MTTLSEELYRQQKEAFVSNHDGTTPQEVILAVLPNIIGLLLTVCILGLLREKLHRNIRFSLEFLLLIVPCVLYCTLLSQHLFHICLIILLLSVIILVFIAQKDYIQLSNENPSVHPQKIAFITNFRAWTNIITVVCILAVDFKIFPRKFAKTEVYGYSLMDTGVGLFIISNALVSKEARGRCGVQKCNFFEKLLNTFKSCKSLIILGLGRLFSIEFLGYQRHVSEYGVHWNFFMTLACVKIITSMFSQSFISRYSAISGFLLLGINECVLNIKELREWILREGFRGDFLSANREGLISIPGYIGLYLIGVIIGKLIYLTYENSDRDQVYSHTVNNAQINLFKRKIAINYNDKLMILCVKLILITLLSFTLTLFLNYYFPVSRRLVNVSYCAWIVTFSTAILTLLLLIEILIVVFIIKSREFEKNRKYMKTRENKGGKENVSDKNLFLQSPEIFEAVNYNGLGFFLFANIITGLINISMRTLNADYILALKVLFGYMFLNVLFVTILYRLRVRIRL